ncbi:MAG: homogentisate 1,2-dioxygenase [Chlamydiota bacterium]|nr:homogentisate 1,2-dioxygenase [Chlamydiota bacterium]
MRIGTLVLSSLLLVNTTWASSYEYLSGFGNHFSSEALEGALPIGQNTPQKAPKGLYAEQLSGTSFTTPRSQNKFIWFYRLRPSVSVNPYHKIENENIQTRFSKQNIDPNPLLWKPLPIPSALENVDFVKGMTTIAGAGSPETKNGLGIHVYVANQSMEYKAFYNADGDMLIVPQEGKLEIQTECGFLTVVPGEICVIPRGIVFKVMIPDGPVRGYICEVFDGHYRLPDLGPIGANGLANPRDFLSPVAAFEDVNLDFDIITKYCGELYQKTIDHSPFDVVAFHGNYVPFKYDLANFCAMNSVCFDHADPSIFTVLTCQTLEPGVAAVDFVIFPPRWSCAEHTFRPPYYHRNCMSEYMGLISGSYEAKEAYLKPGGGTLHNCMTPHGPDASTYQNATSGELKPSRVGEDALAFMFESTYILQLSDKAMDEKFLEKEYLHCWEGIKNNLKLED